VIVRVTRSRIQPGHEAEVLDVVRGLTTTFGAITGLRSAVFGRSIGDRGSVLISITEWADFEAILAVYGENWADRSLLPGVEPFILETTVEHFEATLDEVTAVVDERRAPGSR
jgi:quinol monooxygenase YgiN